MKRNVNLVITNHNQKKLTIDLMETTEGIKVDLSYRDKDGNEVTELSDDDDLFGFLETNVRHFDKLKAFLDAALGELKEGVTH